MDGRIDNDKAGAVPEAINGGQGPGGPVRAEERSLQVDRLRRLAAASLAINSTLALDDVLQLATEQAREIVGAHQGMTSVAVGANGDEIINAVALSDKYAAWRGYNAEADGSGIYSLICDTNQPARLTQAELEAHPAWHGFGAEAGRHPPMRGWLAAPLVGRDGRNLGLIQLSDKYEGEFTLEDEVVLVQLAQMAAAAIENARLYHEAQDATRREQAARAEAVAAREQIGGILGSITDGFLAFDREWNFTYLNAEGARTLGRPAEELLGTNLWVEFPDLADTSFGRLYRRAVAEGAPLELEDYYPPFDAWFAARAYPSEAGLSLYFRDITARRRAEEQQRFLAEASAVLVSSLDFANTLAGLARAAVPFLADSCVMYQLVDDTVLRRVALAHVDPLKEQALREVQRFDIPREADIPVARVVRTGVREVDQHVPADIAERIHPDPAYHASVRALGPRAYICVPLRARGRMLGAVAFIIAESERRYTADDVALAEELAHRAAIALDNARLYEEARAAIQVRDQFLSIAAHELKTPLTSLLGYTQALLRRSAREGTLNERDQRTMLMIVEQCKRLGKLIESLLNVARIQLGRLDIELQPLELCAMVRRLAEEIRPTLDQHTLVVECDEEPLVVAGDELRLEQVLQNLLQNAVKYSPAGGTITLRATRCDDHACLVVADQGIGIPSAALPNLFQRFYRAGNVDPLQMSGMGIGLYVVKEIVTLHGGEVRVESTEGAGSTFTVRLPLAGGPAGPTDAARGGSR